MNRQLGHLPDHASQTQCIAITRVTTAFVGQELKEDGTWTGWRAVMCFWRAWITRSVVGHCPSVTYTTLLFRCDAVCGWLPGHVLYLTRPMLRHVRSCAHPLTSELRTRPFIAARPHHASENNAKGLYTQGRLHPLPASCTPPSRIPWLPAGLHLYVARMYASRLALPPRRQLNHPSSPIHSRKWPIHNPDCTKKRRTVLDASPGPRTLRRRSRSTTTPAVMLRL